MKTKVLITTENTSWGVIVNPISTNTYRHILSFESEEQKQEFVEKKLLKGESLDTAFNRVSETDNIWETDNGGSFRVNVEDYKGILSLDELLNSDFAIIKEENDDNETTYFYVTIQPSLSKNKEVITYSFEIDEFFTNDITDIIKGQVKVERSHLDNYEYKLGIIKPIVDNNNELSNVEEFDNQISENVYFPKLIEQYEQDISKNLIEINTDSPYSEEEQISLIKSLLNETHWFLMYASEKTIFDDLIVNENVYYNSFNEVKTKFYSFMFPSSIRVVIKGNDTIEDSTPDLYSEIIDDPKIIPNSSTLINGINLNNNISKIKLSSGILPNVEITPFIRKSVLNKSVLTDVSISESDAVNSILYNFKNKNIPTWSNEDSKNLDREVKSHYSPYKKYTLISSSGEFDIQPQYADELMRIKMLYSYVPELWSTHYVLESLNTESDSIYSNYSKEYGLFLNDIGSYVLPDSIDFYKDFLISNRQQLTAGYITDSVKVLSGAALITTGVLAGSPFGILGGASQEVQAISSIGQRLAGIKDLKNTPNKTNTSGSTLLQVFIERRLKLRIAEKTILPIYWNLVKEFFYEFGHNRNGKLVDLETEDIFKSRYYFNYVRIEETFENIKGKISAKRKQIINDSLKSGITIWNVRNVDSFKGIKQYDVNNFEMSIYNKVKE